MSVVTVIDEIQIKNNPLLGVVDNSRIMGGMGWVVADNTVRDAIDAGSRQVAMEVKVIDAGGAGTKYYTLGVGLGNGDWTEVAYSGFEETANKGVADGYAPLDADGFIPGSYIKNLFLNDSFVVASEAAMLGLTSLTGNFAIRTDTGDVWVKLNNNGTPSVIGDWSVLSSPGVATVNGLSGGVSIDFTTLLTWGSSSTQFETAVTNSNYATATDSAIGTLQGRATDLETDQHTHANKVILDTIISSGDGLSYFGNDGNYTLLHTHANKGAIDKVDDTGGGTLFFADDGTYKAIGANAAAGSATEIQINEAGIFAAHPDFIYNHGGGIPSVTLASQLLLPDVNEVVFSTFSPGITAKYHPDGGSAIQAHMSASSADSRFSLSGHGESILIRTSASASLSSIWVNSKKCIVMPAGTTGERPTATGTSNLNKWNLRYNTTNDAFEYTKNAGGATWYNIANEDYISTVAWALEGESTLVAVTDIVVGVGNPLTFKTESEFTVRMMNDTADFNIMKNGDSSRFSWSQTAISSEKVYIDTKINAVRQGAFLEKAGPANLFSYAIFGLSDHTETNVKGLMTKYTLTGDATEAYFKDTYDSEGFAYFADYSTNGIITHGDLWVPAYGNVWKWSGTTQLDTALVWIKAGGSMYIQGAQENEFSLRANSANAATVWFDSNASNNAMVAMKAAGVGGDVSIFFDPYDIVGAGAGAYFKDERTIATGFEYFVDTYGAGFTTKSLIHQAYADGRYFINGGTTLLTATTTIEGGGFALYLGTTASRVQRVEVVTSSSGFFVKSQNSATNSPVQSAWYIVETDQAGTAAGFGPQFNYNADDSIGVGRSIGQIEYLWTNAVAANLASDYIISGQSGGTLMHFSSLNAGGLQLGAAAEVASDKTIGIDALSGNANLILQPYGTGSVDIGLSAGKVGFFEVAGVVRQTTSSQTPATFAANSSGISNDTATWNGYTLGDLVAILQAYGLLT